MNLQEYIRYKRRELLSEVYDKTLSSVVVSRMDVGRTPLFIFGSGRNGSTLMSSILNNHPQIFIPPENNIIPFAIKYWYIHPLKSQACKLDRIFQELKKPSMWNVDFQDLKLRLQSEKNVGVDDVLHEIYSAYANEHKTSQAFIWGDKTPSNTISAHIIKKQFPRSKILFLLRDPRAVISSLLDVDYDFHIDRVDHFIWVWKNALNKYEAIMKDDPDSIQLLKYEDFVGNPSLELESLTNWLGLQFDKAIMNNTEENMSLLGVTIAKNHQNLRRNIDPSFADKWKKNLDKDIASHILKKLKVEMGRYGYA